MGEDRDPCLYYRDACLAMLGGSESISEAPTLESSGLLVKTVEDYLYTSLWHALHVTEISGERETIGGSGDGGLRGLAESVSRLSVLINQWGPSYFEQDEDVNGGGVLYTGASDAVAFAARGAGSVTKCCLLHVTQFFHKVAAHICLNYETAQTAQRVLCY